MVYDPNEYREFRRAQREMREQNLGTGFGEKIPWKQPPVAGGKRGPLDKVAAVTRPARATAGSERKVGTASSHEEAADRTMRSSSWTGRRTVQDQLAVIRAYGPIAVQGAECLIEALEDARLNDPDAKEALQSLRDLHIALGELIATVEAGLPTERAWRLFERNKAKLNATMRGSIQAFVVAPVTAFGVAVVLSLLSGEEVSGEMLAILSAALMAKDAVLEYGKGCAK